jgi:hypothetical protein
MANDSIITTNGKKVLLYRAYTQTGSLSGVQYKPIENFQIGINNITPSIAATGLTYPIPIANGVINDPATASMTGSSGGTNTTNNTTTYKPGAGVVDNTAQNLIANGTNVLKIWTRAALPVNIDDTKWAGLWLYIIDAAALAKFKSTLTALQIKLGSSSVNYRSISFTASQLSVGWNWITSSSIVSSWTPSGTPGSPINTFIIEITTNLATDTFAAGDVVFDLLRTWSLADTKKIFVSGYPLIDLTNMEVTTRAYITTLEANGFNVNAIGFNNTDSSPLLLEMDVFTAESKSQSDEFSWVIKDRIL